MKENFDDQNQCWCIYIDILGFSNLWESDLREALKPLNEMMLAIYKIGVNVYPCPGDRLFVHQMGDGFAILSDFREDSLERPIAIATALMRCVAATGKFASAAIAEGGFSDIQGCYPEEVRNSFDSHCVRLGNGIMTLSSVMGTAFIRAYRLHQKAPSGPYLIVPERYNGRIPSTLWRKPIKGGKLSIDWIRSQTQLLTEIQDRACLRKPRANELLGNIQDYCIKYPDIDSKWNTPLCGLLHRSA